VEKYCRAGQATCKTKATNTHSEYVILIAFPLQRWLHERVSRLSYAYMACLVAHKVGDIIIHRLLQLHSISSLSHRKFHHDQWFRPTKNSTCLGMAYVHHRKMCIVWKGQETVFKVMTKIPIPEGSLSLYSRTPLIRINWDDKPSGYAENQHNFIFL